MDWPVQIFLWLFVVLCFAVGVSGAIHWRYGTLDRVSVFVGFGVGGVVLYGLLNQCEAVIYQFCGG